MPAPIAIRALCATDMADYRTIRLAALRHAPETFGAVHADEAVKPIEQHYARLASSIVLGAYADGQIVGMIGLRQEEGSKDRHKAFVWGFYVQAAERHRGVGSALLAAILQAARGIVEQVTLSVVEDNKAAIALYERFGFTRYGLEPRALKTARGYANEVLMVHFLASGHDVT